MIWSCIRLPAGPDAADEHRKLQAKFESFYRAAHSPRDMAMFGSASVSKGLLDFYFTPAVADVAYEFLHLVGAQSCERPRPDSVLLLVGHDDALERLRLGTL